jgi:hypothetical protein
MKRAFMLCMMLAAAPLAAIVQSAQQFDNIYADHND